MQPYLFPYIGYFQLMASVDKFVLLDDVNFINRGWINRNRILANSKECLFTVPLRGASQNKLIREIEISVELHWKHKLLKTIAQSYSRAPYYDAVYPVVERIINCEIPNLSEYVHHSIVEINEYLGIRCVLVPTSSVYNNKNHRGQDRIMDICRKEAASEYINLPGGQELYESEKFSNCGVELKFINPLDFKYKQFGGDFVPRLSIIDVMMFNSNGQIIDAISCSNNS